MATVRQFGAYLSSDQGELTLWFDYKDTNDTVEALVYTNNFPWDADFWFKNDIEDPVSIVFTRNTVEAVVPVTPNKYILETVLNPNRKRLPRTMQVRLSMRSR